MARIAIEGAIESVAVVANDEAEARPFQNVIYSSDPSTVMPDTLLESVDERSLELSVPLVVADFWGGTALNSSRRRSKTP